MNLSVNNLKKYLTKDDNYFGINFLLIFIVLSSIKFFGYAIGFIFTSPFLFFNKKNIYSYLKKINFEQKLVLLYFLYFIIQSFIGAYTLKDLRIILYWPTFFIICLLAYFYNNFKISTDIKYKNNFKDIIFNSSILYFILFFIINIISFLYYGNEYDIQDLFWVGGSTSFNISSFFLFILYSKWSEIRFKLFSIYSIYTLFYSFLICLNESRLGQLYLVFFLFFIILQSIKIKSIINALLIFLMCFYTFTLSSHLIYPVKKYFKPTSGYTVKTASEETQMNISTILNIRKDLKNPKESKSWNGDTGRIIELAVGIDKFKNSTISEKIIGTGWYSSRITIYDSRSKIIDKFGLDTDHLIKTKVTHLQGIVSLLVDTGLIGFLSTFILFGISLKNILFFKYSIIDKLFYSILICINFLTLFIGYPWISLPFILLLVPNGIFLLEEKV